MRLSLNKNSLKQQRDQLAMFRRFLPSLDLKRQQLLGAWKQSCQQLAQAQQEIDQYQQSLDRLLPLLGSSTLQTCDLSSLVRVREVAIGEENVVGVHVPLVLDMEFERSPYSALTLPFWVDQLVDNLENLAKLRVQFQVHQARVEKLGAAVRKITQRVNLFGKVLIPTAQDNIKRIRIALSDEERAAVVRSKLSKRKRH
ncbi:V-type ATP synthase subunit D [Symmachiella macrocystis]|uniref:V-type ATP synthase subunit D n=1 Tax=Symmachiella macrocystis TaxID=2527985 RepID=A0A5C6BAX2_9PLAN|nr:V-type ATP synthase subunit D [Symmachiella macrocystis]TWU08812.1 V-type ATP synthase subunit D [Symmachiella macrocystis]